MPWNICINSTYISHLVNGSKHSQTLLHKAGLEDLMMTIGLIKLDKYLNFGILLYIDTAFYRPTLFFLFPHLVSSHFHCHVQIVSIPSERETVQGYLFSCDDCSVPFWQWWRVYTSSRYDLFHVIIYIKNKTRWKVGDKKGIKYTLTFTSWEESCMVGE